MRTQLNRGMKWAIFLVALYVGLAVTARFLAGRALYQPGYASRQPPRGLERVRDANGHEIAVLHLPNPSARFTLWFFHGNAESLGDLGPTMELFHAAGFAVFAFDYPGYGVSTGAPDEESLYASARAAREHLRTRLGVPAERTILYGRSLGGGPAVQMAVEERCAGLILQSAFTSVFRVLTQVPVFPADLFENLRKLPRVEMPILVMHGHRDEVIPFRHGERLLAAARGPKRALFVPEAHHNDFSDAAGPRYFAALRDFSALCGNAGGANP